MLPCTLFFALWHAFFPKDSSRRTRQFNWAFGRVTLTLLRPVLPAVLNNRDVAVKYPGSILICNHQSALDIYLLAAQNQSDLCLVAKHWPFKLFFFAPAMRHAGYIDAEAISPEELENICRQRLKEGATLVMFPEGHRSRTGELGRFHSGAFRMAQVSGRPVLPLVIHNSHRVFPPKAKWFSIKPIRMEFLEPVWPQKFAQTSLPHRDMMRHTRELYLRCLK